MSLRAHIESQFPSLFITLVSILVAIFFDDLFSEARSRMALWPLDIGTLRTWGQLFGMAFSAVAIWVFLAHIGMSRRAVPTLADTIIVFLAPVPLLFGNTFVGQKEIWPWFYYAAGYLAVSVVTVHWQLRLLLKQPELASFRILNAPFGPLGVLYVGVPFYALAGWLDQHGPLPPLIQMLLALGSGPPAALFSWLFFRDWQKAILAIDKDNSADYSVV